MLHTHHNYIDDRCLFTISEINVAIAPVASHTLRSSSSFIIHYHHDTIAKHGSSVDYFFLKKK